MKKEQNLNEPQGQALNIPVCPQPKEKPINISFDELCGESGMTINPESYYLATISVSICLDKNAVEKYVEKRLTIKDLNDMIKCRK